MIKPIASMMFCVIAIASFAQKVGINTTSPVFTLDIRGKAVSPITIYVEDTISSGARVGVQSNVYSMAPTTAAIAGVAWDGWGSGVTPIESQRYAIVGQTNSAIGVAGYTLSGTALRGSSASGLALHTTGLVKLEGIGEGAGKVLTSDALGNANWQSLSGSHDHFGETWNGAASFGLAVLNSATDGTGMSGSGRTGVSGWSSSASGYGLLGVNYSSGNYHPLFTNVGVAGVAGDGYGVFAASVSGTSLYAYKANIGSGAGMVALFENQKTGLTTPVVKIIGVSAQPALEVNNGFIKVSGTNKTAFTITATAGNSSGHILNLNYANQATTDIIIVTHNYNPPGGPSNYHDYNVGVYWTGVNWAIYNENTSIPILNKSFNVLVIKQ